MIISGQMNKLAILPIFFLSMCAPAPVTPPVDAMEVEEELMWKALEYIQNYNTLQKQKTEPDDAINSALDDFWEDSYGNNGSTESEELLQLSGNGD